MENQSGGEYVPREPEEEYSLDLLNEWKELDDKSSRGEHDPEEIALQKAEKHKSVRSGNSSVEVEEEKETLEKEKRIFFGFKTGKPIEVNNVQ